MKNNNLSIILMVLGLSGTLFLMAMLKGDFWIKIGLYFTLTGIATCLILLFIGIRAFDRSFLEEEDL